MQINLKIVPQRPSGLVDNRIQRQITYLFNTNDSFRLHDRDLGGRYLLFHDKPYDASECFL